MMNEENMMGDIRPTTVRSESAFSGTSNEEPDISTKSSVHLPFPYNRRSDVVRAITYNQSYMIYVPRWIIPNHESKTDVIEVLVSRTSNSAERFLLYTVHAPSSRKAIASLFQIR